MANYSKDEILEKYGITQESLYKVLMYLELSDYFNYASKRSRINGTELEALNVIINAKPEVKPYIGKYSKSKCANEKTETPAITKITFKIGKETYSITNELLIDYVRRSLAKTYLPDPIKANRQPEVDLAMLRGWLHDFIQMRGKDNKRQQFIDAGNFLADIGYLMDADEWFSSKNPGAYNSYDDYLEGKVKGLMLKKERST